MFPLHPASNLASTASPQRYHRDYLWTILVNNSLVSLYDISRGTTSRSCLSPICHLKAKHLDAQ